MTAHVDAAIADCGADLFDGKGHTSNEPIFIVGLPRAGSTLLEQIQIGRHTSELQSQA